MNTSAVKSAISFIDGDKGILRYRGYPIEQLAEKSHFTEVCCVSLYFAVGACSLIRRPLTIVQLKASCNGCMYFYKTGALEDGGA